MKEPGLRKAKSTMNYNPYDPYCISEKYKIIAKIKTINQQLDCHPICNILSSNSRIQVFVSYHIFDAWDINKLVLPLQSKISIASLKKSNKYHYELKRLLEETILNRPTELYPYGKPNRDFANYLHAVAEVCIDSDSYLWYFLKAPNNLDELKPGIKALAEFNSSVANWGTISEMIAVLLLGKKQLDLRAFTKIVEVFTSEARECPFLVEYTEKLRLNQGIQSELLALKLLNYFCQDEAEQIRALQTGLKALYLRKLAGRQSRLQTRGGESLRQVAKKDRLKIEIIKPIVI
jgi:hypothetical protein